MAIFWRLWATASATMAIAILILVGLTLIQFGNLQRTLLAERVAVLARNTAAPFEATTGLGFPLSSVRNAAALLERARQSDAAIAAIHLVDREGRVLRQVGDASTDIHALDWPEGWRSRPANLFDGDRFYSFNPIAGPGAGAPGAVIVSMDASNSVIRIWAIGAELAVAAMVFLAAGAGIIGFILRRAFSAEIAAFDAVEADIEGFERDSWRGPDAAGSEPGGELRQVLNEAYGGYRRAVGDLAAEGRPD
ncbi:MAG: hypothetical protein ACK5JR_07265 [Tropicimonas sp.]|uniref:hypothetical protein n=1 Tax=Tropicimonas sp. TaxID=2067044 RepID=UPI003A8469BC